VKTNRRLVSAICIIAVLIFLYAPIALLIYRSFNFNGGPVFKAYVNFFNDKAALEALKNTVVIAVLSACISTVIGTAAAVGISKYRNRKIKQAVMLVTNIPMTSPDIVTAISLVLLFGLFFTFLGVNDFLGFYSLLISHITFEIPYVILSVLPKIRQMDRSQTEAALDLGCRPFQAFFKVELPQLMPGIFTGLIMAFTMSLDDFVISYFVGSSDFQTLPLLIYSMTKKQVKPDMYALSTLIIVTIFILLIVTNVKSGKKTSRSDKGGKKA